MMKIESIEYQSGLSFEDVVEYIATLTTDNEVVTDNEITKFAISANEETCNLFYDSTTGHFCIDECSLYASEYLYFIGEFIQTNYSFYKDNLGALILAINKTSF